MREAFCLAVYGTFKDNDIRLKFFNDSSTKRFEFQNIMHDAGYDCVVFSVNNGDLADCLDMDKLMDVLNEVR